MEHMMHKGKTETWIAARAIVNRGWTATPRHARPGRHACPSTRRGRRVLAAVFGRGA